MKYILFVLLLSLAGTASAQLSPELMTVARRYFHVLPGTTDPQEWVKQLQSAPTVLASDVSNSRWLFQGRFHNPQMMEDADSASLLFGLVNTYHKNLGTGATVLASSYYTYIQEYTTPAKNFSWKQWKRYCKEIVKAFSAKGVARELTAGTAGRLRVYSVTDPGRTDPKFRIRFGKSHSADWFLSLEFQYPAAP